MFPTLSCLTQVKLCTLSGSLYYTLLLKTTTFFHPWRVKCIFYIMHFPLIWHSRTRGECHRDLSASLFNSALILETFSFIPWIIVRLYLCHLLAWLYLCHLLAWLYLCHLLAWLYLCHLLAWLYLCHLQQNCIFHY